MDIFADWSEISGLAKVVHAVIWIICCIGVGLLLRPWGHGSSAVRRIGILVLVAAFLGVLLLLSMHLVDWGDFVRMEWRDGDGKKVPGSRTRGADWWRGSPINGSM